MSLFLGSQDTVSSVFWTIASTQSFLVNGSFGNRRHNMALSYAVLRRHLDMQQLLPLGSLFEGMFLQCKTNLSLLVTDTTQNVGWLPKRVCTLHAVKQRWTKYVIIANFKKREAWVIKGARLNILSNISIVFQSFKLPCQITLTAA